MCAFQFSSFSISFPFLQLCSDAVRWDKVILESPQQTHTLKLKYWRLSSCGCTLINDMSITFTPTFLFMVNGSWTLFQHALGEDGVCHYMVNAFILIPMGSLQSQIMAARSVTVEGNCNILIFPMEKYLGIEHQSVFQRVNN